MTHEYDLTEQSDLDMLDEVDGEYDVTQPPSYLSDAINKAIESYLNF